MSTLSGAVEWFAMISADEFKLGFFSDPHGDFSAISRVLKTKSVPANCFFLGDFDLTRPMDQELAPLLAAGVEVHWIAGNHDADRQDWHDFVFQSALASRNITAKVVELNGVRVAGLGGVFHEEVWHPKDGAGQPKYVSRSEYLDRNGHKAWRAGLPLRHRSTIFMEDFNALAGLQADVLISHEAPSSHKYGHSQIDDLAEIMGVKLIVHGHLHQRYSATLPCGIDVIGLEKAGFLSRNVEDLVA